jgi:hypothetical protein
MPQKILVAIWLCYFSIPSARSVPVFSHQNVDSCSLLFLEDIQRLCRQLLGSHVYTLHKKERPPVTKIVFKHLCESSEVCFFLFPFFPLLPCFILWPLTNYAGTAGWNGFQVHWLPPWKQMVFWPCVDTMSENYYTQSLPMIPEAPWFCNTYCSSLPNS